MKKILVALMLLPLFSIVTAANGVGNLCLGTCVIDAPVYTNVYWDQTWDQDVQAAGSTDFLRARIDAATQALVRSGYFSQLAQYKVWSVSMGSSITPACPGAPASMDLVLANNNHLLNSFVDCIFAAYPSLKNKNTILNIFFPPSVVVGKWGYGADHKNLRGIALTLLPTNQGYSSPNDFSRLLELASHEMVEAATDPNPQSPTGYRNKDIGNTAGQEIADLCNGAVSFLGIGDGSALLGVTQYWSDNANNCVTPFPTLTPPLISRSTVCGTGRNMNITLTGTFGPTPWDLVANPANGQTLYVQAAINKTWNAGSLLNIPPSTPPITVGFGSVSWQQGSPDTIVLNGFDSNYGSSGQVVKPGDQIQVSVYSPLNGQSSPATTVTAPAPASVWLGYQAIQANAGSSVPLTGQVLDPSMSQNCGIGGTQLKLQVSANSTSAGSINSPVATTDDGSFTATFTAPAIAGTNTLKADASPASRTASISILPVLTKLSASIGTFAGKQQIMLTGCGFDNSTTISFSGIGQSGQFVSNNAVVNSVSADHHTVTLTTPKSPLPGDGTGDVSVNATVNGVSGGMLQYVYIVPGKPVGTIEGDLCQRGPYNAKVTAYNANGSMDQVTINLSSTAPMFDKGLFQLPVQSGAMFQINRAGTFTATNTTNSESTVITFKCNLAISGPGMLPVNFIPGPNCDGECGGPSGNSSIWTWGEASEQSSLVISGIPAGEVQQTYKVTGVSGATLARLVDANSSVTIAAGTPAVNATFIRQPVSIELANQSNAASIKHSTLLSFAVPTSVDANYQIVRYERRGTEFVWAVVPQTPIVNKGNVIQAPITETGLYALVSTGTQ